MSKSSFTWCFVSFVLSFFFFVWTELFQIRLVPEEQCSFLYSDSVWMTMTVDGKSDVLTRM